MALLQNSQPPCPTQTECFSASRALINTRHSTNQFSKIRLHIFLQLERLSGLSGTSGQKLTIGKIEQALIEGITFPNMCKEPVEAILVREIG